jgi:hypothetical protein
MMLRSGRNVASIESKRNCTSSSVSHMNAKRYLVPMQMWQG